MQAALHARSVTSCVLPCTPAGGQQACRSPKHDIVSHSAPALITRPSTQETHSSLLRRAAARSKEKRGRWGNARAVACGAREGREGMGREEPHAGVWCRAARLSRRVLRPPHASLPPPCLLPGAGRAWPHSLLWRALAAVQRTAGGDRSCVNRWVVTARGQQCRAATQSRGARSTPDTQRMCCSGGQTSPLPPPPPPPPPRTSAARRHRLLSPSLPTHHPPCHPALPPLAFPQTCRCWRWDERTSPACWARCSTCWRARRPRTPPPPPRLQRRVGWGRGVRGRRKGALAQNVAPFLPGKGIGRCPLPCPALPLPCPLPCPCPAPAPPPSPHKPSNLPTIESPTSIKF